LQQTVDGIKLENDGGVLSEGNPTVMETGEVSVPSAFSVPEDEPQVSFLWIVFATCGMSISFFGMLKIKTCLLMTVNVEGDVLK
jgi:hypothetical protein